ncbi:MAG: flagellar biosynthesis regulator FlaF [Rhodospirillales bacterium]|nr:flagellar biosynthesis regulator FlaF [Rhodospirillales bacterium]
MANASQSEELSPIEESAYSLSEAAVMMDKGREDQGMLAAALEKDIETWIAIRLLAGQDDTGINAETQQNLIQLSKFVADTIMSNGLDLSSESLDTLININLQISEGLLEGQ